MWTCICHKAPHIISRAFRWVCDLPHPLPGTLYFLRPPALLSALSLFHCYFSRFQLFLVFPLKSQEILAPRPLRFPFQSVPHVPPPTIVCGSFGEFPNDLQKTPLGSRSLGDGCTGTQKNWASFIENLSSDSLTSSDSGSLPHKMAKKAPLPHGFHKTKCIPSFTRHTFTESTPCSQNRFNL